MAVQLTSGYSDTGTTDSFTMSGMVELNASGNSSTVRLGLRGVLVGFGQVNWILREIYYQSGGDWISDLQLTQPLGDNAGSFPPAPTIIDSINHGPSPPVANTFFAPVSFASTLGPYRLGAHFTLGSSGGPATAPAGLADTSVLRYAWFRDIDTEYNETVGGVNETVAAGGTPAILTSDVSMFTVTAGPSSPGVGVPIAKFTAVTIDGIVLDTDGIDDAPTLFPQFSQVAAGAFNINAVPLGVFLEAAPGGSLTFATDMLDYAGNTVTPDLTDDWVTQPETFHAAPKTPDATFLTSGTYSTDFQTNYPRAEKNLPGAVTHSTDVGVDAAWLASEGYDPNDLTVVLDQASPITGDPTYSPVLIEQQGAIEIDTPTGGRPSSWVINSGANGSVTENAGDTVFNVTNVAAVFTRSYATNWRAYTVNSHVNPQWNIDGYTYLRRNYAQDYLGIPQTVYPEDYWWWNSYMFLRLNITATASATLTLVVSGIDLQVNDNHSGIPGVRSAGITYNAFTDTRTYVVDVVNGGPTDYWVDLSFPDTYVAAGGAVFPMRRPRVESLSLSASAVGTYTLNAMELSRRDPAGYATEVSIAYSPQSTYNAEWPGIYLRTDGEATPVLTYGDTLKKGLEAELGGAVRFAEPEAGSVSQARYMWEQLQRIEGFTVTYTDGARAVFMEDIYGVALVTQAIEPSQFAQERAPGDVFVGAGDAHGYSPDFAIRVGSVQFPNGLSLAIRPRHVFGGGVEAVAMENGTRAGAGLNFDVLDQANTTLGSVVSDTRGRIHFEPVGHGKVVRFVPA